ncbi:LOW QUALITY PROTEIN: doublesex- and mab-3-related transcription factor C1-like [Hipposideros larvatus]
MREWGFLGRRLHEQEERVQSDRNAGPDVGFTKVRGSVSGAGDRVTMLTSAPGSRTMVPKEKKTAVAHTHSTTSLDSRVPCRMELRPRRAVSHCVRCHNHGFTNQIKSHTHFCFFQTCQCHKCAFFSKHGKALPVESALKRERGACLGRRLTGALVKSRAAPPKNRKPVKKLAVEPGVFGNRPRDSADWSDPRIFVSVLDSSSLDEATNNFSFQEFAQDPCPVQHIDGIESPAENGEGRDGEGGPQRPRGFNPLALPFPVSGHSTPILQPYATLDHLLLQPRAPAASDQALVSAASEWQQMLEAAEALLTLKQSAQAPSGSTSSLQLCVASAPAGDRGFQPARPSLSRPASPVSQPLGHAAYISLLS